MMTNENIKMSFFQAIVSLRKIKCHINSVYMYVVRVSLDMRKVSSISIRKKMIQAFVYSNNICMMQFNSIISNKRFRKTQHIKTWL